MAYVKHHGIELAQNADIRNLVVEKLATDPTPSAAGRMWYNTASKTYKISTLDSGGAVVIKSFHTLEEFNTFVASLNSETGSTLVGYAGFSGSNGKFSLTSSSLKSSLDSIVAKIDSNTQSIDDIGTGNLVAMQGEIDATQTGAGLGEDGSYMVPAVNNYLAGTTSLLSATSALDTALKTEETARIQAVSDEATARSDADALIRSDFADVATGKGASLIGVEDAADQFTATTVEGVLAELQSNLESEIGAISLQSVYDSSIANVDGDAILKLTADKTIKFMDNDLGTTYFKIDPNGENPLNVEMTGPIAVTGDMTISGNLLVNGATTQIDSTITSSDHFALAPEGSVPAISVEPGATFAGESVIDIKAANGGASVVSMGTDGILDVNKLAIVTSAGFSGNFSLDGATVTDFNNVVLHNVGTGVADTDAVNVGQLNSAIASNTSTQDELDVSQTAIGLAENGTYVVPTATNYLNATTSLMNADAVLDSTVFSVTGGAGLAASGAYVADATTNYLTAATSLFDADKKLDAQLKTLSDDLATQTSTLRSDINARKYAVETPTAATSHTITHGLATPFVNYTVLTQGDDGKYRNDTVAVTEVDNNTLLVELFETRKVKVIVESAATL